MNKYEYVIVYGLDGKVDVANPYAADWISVGGEAQYAPLNILEVVSSRWQGHNPYITEANVRSVDLANGGGSGRFARNTPPTWRPVNSYEAGRAPLFAGNTRPADASGASPRRGLLRVFGIGR